MPNSTQEFYREAQKAVQEFDQFMRDYDLVGRVKADHICYKCDSPEEFEKIRTMFEYGESRFVYQSMISKRRIALIGNRNTIETIVGDISLIELSDQKPDNSQASGMDHIEIYTQGDVTYDNLVTELKSKGIEVQEIVRPHHTTHDIALASGFLVRLTREPLLEKVKTEMTY